MHKTTFSIKGSSQENVVKGIQNVGYNTVSLNQPIGSDVVRDIINSLSTSIRNRLSTGRAELIPRGSAVFSKDGDTVGVYDYDIQERRIIDTDPFVIVEEQIPGRTSGIIVEILEDVVKVDIIKNSLLSLDSRQFKTSIDDLARLQNADPREVYNKCITSIVKSCVGGIKTIDVDPFELTTQLKTPQAKQIPKQKVTAI